MPQFIKKRRVLIEKMSEVEKIAVYGLWSCILFLWACVAGIYLIFGFPEKIIVLEKNIKEYEVIGIDPPKHFYLDLKDKQTGQLFNHVYVSKHCFEWQNLKLGSVYSFEEVTYKYEKEPDKYKYIKIDGQKFCNDLS